MMERIETSKLSPHPNNPRRDLGDLTELADSIRANGIFQNLTVVPYLGEVSGEPLEGIYRVVIGHRRLAAAKLAGLSEVPCVIAEMNEATQVATMMLENMQRNDLTLWEQAQGFQMMMDFGENMGSICEKTGLSESTVRRRMKLLELDGDTFQKSLERGGTLQDYMELDKIKDAERRNEVLKNIGSPNFRSSLLQALDAEKREKRRAEVIALLSEFATETQREDTWELQYVQGFNFYRDDEARDFGKPADADEREYFYKATDYNVTLYAEKSEKKGAQPTCPSELELRRREQEERRAPIEAAERQAFELRKDFIANFTGLKKKAASIMAFAVYSIFVFGAGESSFDIKLYAELMGLAEDADADTLAALAAATPEKALLVAAYCNFGDGPQNGYADYWGKYEDDEDGRAEMDYLYSALEKLGYEMSDDEKALRDGSHPAYVTDEDDG